MRFGIRPVSSRQDAASHANVLRPKGEDPEQRIRRHAIGLIVATGVRVFRDEFLR